MRYCKLGREQILRDAFISSTLRQNAVSRHLKGLRLPLIALFITAFAPLVTLAEQRLADPALESRAEELFRQFRCLVCQNQSIFDSNAEIAQDLRTIVRERIVAGDSNADISAFLVARYGDWVLLKPPFDAGTLALWLLPFLLIALALGLFAWRVQARRTSPAAAVPPAPTTDPSDQAALDAFKREHGA